MPKNPLARFFFWGCGGDITFLIHWLGQEMPSVSQDNIIQMSNTSPFHHHSIGQNINIPSLSSEQRPCMFGLFWEITLPMYIFVSNNKP